MTASTVLFPIAADIPGAPRCPHRSPTGMQCEKEDHHHLADYPASDDCGARDTRGAWRFWKPARPAKATLTCLATHPNDRRITCALTSGHDHTATNVIHESAPANGLTVGIAWVEVRDPRTMPTRRREW